MLLSMFTALQARLGLERIFKAVLVICFALVFGLVCLLFSLPALAVNASVMARWDPAPLATGYVVYHYLPDGDRVQIYSGEDTTFQVQLDEVEMPVVIGVAGVNEAGEGPVIVRALVPKTRPPPDQINQLTIRIEIESDHPVELVQ